MPLVANLVSLTATAWGITSALGGWLSDLIGRRPLLIASPFALALAMVAQAWAGSFFWVALWAAVGGGCAGAFSGVIFAEVSGRVPDSQRGRALGWVMSGQSLTLVVGVPMAAAVGSIIGWRGWLVCVGGLALAACLSLYFTVGRGSAGHTRGDAARPSLKSALSPRVLGLLGTGVAERICYGLAAVYFATFMQVTYHMSLLELAIPLAVFALGNVAGTVLGGQLADRLRDRLLTFAVAMALSGIAALALFMWHPGPVVSIAVGFVYVLLNALGRPSALAPASSTNITPPRAKNLRSPTISAVVSGAKRSSPKAADRALQRTSSRRPRQACSVPAQPRKRPPASCRLTKVAPRPGRRGCSAGGGASRPRASAIASRAWASRAAPKAASATGMANSASSSSGKAAGALPNTMAA